MMKVLQFIKSAVKPADYLDIVLEFNHFRAQSWGRKALNRLTPANVDKLAFIYMMNEIVLERIAQSQNQPLDHRNEANSTVISWEDLTEDGWLTLEDTYMDIHWASGVEVDAIMGEFTYQPASDGEETIMDKFKDQDGSESEETGGVNLIWLVYL
ncbi:uncharacterized protein FTOL_13257 [Fusarium torulosum]|uniref:Uncharacterized protein n=1 Tax=Fusarium torulosum TaxID=33205 RepID=A0AAE8MLU2_9HYPO|nr:uncharacterized protein FTOL_13257 [Fusarium torulosum]